MAKNELDAIADMLSNSISLTAETRNEQEDKIDGQAEDASGLQETEDISAEESTEQSVDNAEDEEIYDSETAAEEVHDEEENISEEQEDKTNLDEEIAHAESELHNQDDESEQDVNISGEEPAEEKEAESQQIQDAEFEEVNEEASEEEPASEEGINESSSGLDSALEQISANASHLPQEEGIEEKSDEKIDVTEEISGNKALHENGLSEEKGADVPKEYIDPITEEYKIKINNWRGAPIHADEHWAKTRFEHRSVVESNFARERIGELKVN